MAETFFAVSLVGSALAFAVLKVDEILNDQFEDIDYDA